MAWFDIVGEGELGNVEDDIEITNGKLTKINVPPDRSTPLKNVCEDSAD